MPAKKVITNEMIIKKSLELLNEKGINAINAREIAKSLGCSTQPIYLAFKNMEELKEELFKACQLVYFDYVKSSNETSLFLQYLASLAYFAYDMPNLFSYIYVERKYIETQEEKAFAEGVIQKITEIGNISTTAARKFYLSGFIYAYGIATQIVSGYYRWEKNEIKELLNEQFLALKKYLKEE